MTSTLTDPRGEKEGSIDLQGIPVKLLLGPEQTTFFVHSAVLCKRSEFFNAALKDEWIEGQHRVVKLPDDDPEIFETYIQWLYTGTVFSKVKGKFGSSNYVHLAKLYTLGEKLVDAVFQNQVVDAIVAGVREADTIVGTPVYPGQIEINMIYHNTPPGNPARRLMVDIWQRWGCKAWVVEETNNVSPEFLVDLMRALFPEGCSLIQPGRRIEGLENGCPDTYYKKL